LFSFFLFLSSCTKKDVDEFANDEFNRNCLISIIQKSDKAILEKAAFNNIFFVERY